MVCISPGKDFSQYFGKEGRRILPGPGSYSPGETTGALLPVDGEGSYNMRPSFGAVVGCYW